MESTLVGSSGMTTIDTVLMSKRMVSRFHSPQCRQTPSFLSLYRILRSHVPLEALSEYLERHDSDMLVRRRKALAMLSAIDDGGLIKALEDEAANKSLIFYVGDNGAP